MSLLEPQDLPQQLKMYQVYDLLSPACGTLHYVIEISVAAGSCVF